MTRTALKIREILLWLDEVRPLVDTDSDLKIRRHNPQQLRAGAWLWYVVLPSGRCVGSHETCRDLITAWRRDKGVEAEFTYGDVTLWIREGC